jgi:peptidoglycan hydrolase-like protein with peptidoglycan-binding domain
MSDAATSRPGRSGARLRAVGAASVVIVASAGVIAALGFGGDSDQGKPNQRSPATATITRQTLVDTKTVDAELGYGPSHSVPNRLSGTLTWLPEVGAVIGRGQTLYRVDDRPVMLMFGTLPAYRDLGSGDTGPDVRQLEENLAALGYSGFTVDQDLTSATATAVSRWQHDRGLPQSGRVTLGTVVFGPGEIRIASLKAATGEPAPPGQAVLAYTGTARVVTVQLDLADQRLATTDAAVTVALPDGTRALGKIDRTYTVIESSQNPNSSPQTKLELIVSLSDPNAGAGLQQASVDVIFKASERKDVLTVPVAALVALAEGGYGVEIIDGTSSHYVAVETGLFAGGRVEIRGEGLADGMTVGMPA